MTDKTLGFIQRAESIHGKGFYDYSKVIFVNCNSHVIIICKIHKEFSQTPNNHYRYGCRKCGRDIAANKTKQKAKDGFIEKAQLKHGDLYDYSDVDYITAKVKVKIKCRIHGIFEQTPDSHIRGNGCRLCANYNLKLVKSYDNNEFIKLAKKIHDDNYDYSDVEYIDSQTYVIIKCKIHGIFKQIPSSHLKGHGCGLCAGVFLSNTNHFIEKSKIIHGNNKYDYSLVNYINAKTKVKIICKIHGIFEQTPNSHLSGKGCILCAGILLKTKEEFINECILIHGNLFDYSEVEYINAKTKVKIICEKHGLFEQTPINHLCGKGCGRCIGHNKSTEDFIEESKLKHGDNNYDYSVVDYINSKTKVKIICKIHGIFEQTPNSHLRGRGCSRCCNSANFSRRQIQWLNYISIRDNIFIQTAENSESEFCIPNTNYKADGYCHETNTIYEFHGDFWHGNPKKFVTNAINPIIKKTYGELYESTIKRENTIKQMGYNLVVIWEYDWVKLNKACVKLQRCYRNQKYIK
jgi:hypothetical protein